MGTIQMTCRVAEETQAAVDSEVERGHAKDRAEFIRGAVEAELRRLRIARDRQAYIDHPETEDDEFAPIAAATAEAWEDLEW